MIGSLPARLLLIVFGYLYPAFESYKFIERHDDLETDQLKFLCQYWVLVAVFTSCERIGDNIVSWLPFYNEVKVALLLYLWHPKTRGTIYVYGSFLRPYLVKHDKEIDIYLLDLRNKTTTLAALLCQKALSLTQYRFFEILQYVSSRSTLEMSSKLEIK